MSLARVKWREMLARFGLLLALLLMVVVLSLLSDRFFTPSNIVNVLRQISINAIIAFGMTVVIIARGIDLSVGSLLAFVGVFSASLAVAGVSAPLAMLAALVAGLILGALNGAFVAFAGVAPFIVTLAGLTIFRGMALAWTDGRPISGLPSLFASMGYGTFLGLPMPIWIMLAFLLVTYVLLRHTALGRSIYAIGGGLLEVLISPIIEACPTDNKEKAMSLLHSFYGFVQARTNRNLLYHIQTRSFPYLAK